MLDVLIPTILIVLGTAALLGTRRGDMRMAVTEEKARKAEEIVRKTREKVDRLLRERKRIVAEYREKIDRLDKDDAVRRIAEL